MTRLSTRAIENLGHRMGSMDEGSVRYRVLDCARHFKTSWVELGQSLYSVWRDRLYKEWGYATFDAYTSKEIGIKKATAMKLLRSYYFLEKEEPHYLGKDHSESKDVKQIPSYESVNILRLAKAKEILDRDDYAGIRRGVLEMGRDAAEVKRDLTALMRQREELEPEEARRKKRTAVIKRLLAALKTLRTDIETSKMLPASLIRETSELIKKIESEI